jgi:hypothetical protein
MPDRLCQVRDNRLLEALLAMKVRVSNNETCGGAPGGAAAGYGPRKPVLQDARASGRDSQPRPQGARATRSQGKPKGRRSAAPWRLPALHFLA